LLGWRVAMLLSAAWGAVFCGLPCFQIKHHPMLRSPAEEMSSGVVLGIVFGSALGGMAIVAGWLIHQLAQITIRVRFPKSRNKKQGR